MPRNSDSDYDSDPNHDDTWPREEDDKTWEKAGKGFGPIQKGGNEGDGRETPLFKPGERTALEVERYQKDGGYLIPKKPFRRLVGEVFRKATEESEVARIENSAIEVLQTITETHMALVLNGKFPYVPACGSGTNEAGHLIASGQSAAHAGRHTLRVEDLTYVENILRTRMGPLGDSHPSTRANQRARDTVQCPTSLQGSTAGMRSKRIESRGRGARG